MSNIEVVTTQADEIIIETEERNIEIALNKASEIIIDVESIENNIEVQEQNIDIGIELAPIDIGLTQEIVTVEIGNISGGGSGTSNHAALSNLDYANSGHTGDLDLGNYKLTTKDIRTVGNVDITYSGDYISTILKNGRTITYTNDGEKYTQWEDSEYIWTPTYSNDVITDITVTSK